MTPIFNPSLPNPNKNDKTQSRFSIDSDHSNNELTFDITASILMQSGLLDSFPEA